MSFATTFTDLRTRRRIPMRLFEERVGINPSYIHKIEKEGLLPSPEKLELLASVFVDVAREQEAADPEENARRLFRERERAALGAAVEQLGLDPKLASTLMSLRELDRRRQQDIVQPLHESIKLFGALEAQERSAVKRLLPGLLEFLESGDEQERKERAAFLGEAAEAAIKRWFSDEEDSIRPEDAMAEFTASDSP